MKSICKILWGLPMFRIPQRRGSRGLIALMAAALLLGTQLLPTETRATHVSAELSLVPGEVATDGTVAITIICPPSSDHPTTGNVVPLTDNPAAFTEVITPLAVELITTVGPGAFANAGYLQEFATAVGITLPDGRVRFDVEYPTGGAGSAPGQWQPGNPDFPVGEGFPGTELEGEYLVIAQCFYGLGTPDGHAVIAPNTFFKVTGVMPVSIDIKPGSFPNSINPKRNGVIPVAILTTDSFDATTVDPTTVLFGRTGTEATPVQSALEDVDGDGDTDMILHFNTQATGIQCGDTSASLTGETFSGQIIQGSDSVKTAGCK